MRTSKAKSGGMGRASCKMLALAVAIAACLPTYVAAAEPEVAQETLVKFDIPAGDLSVALERFSTQSGIQAMYRQDLVAGKHSRAVSGNLPPLVALARLLEGTGLVPEHVNARTYVLKYKPVTNAESGASARPGRAPVQSREHVGSVKELEKMVVVGSRLGVNPSDSVLPVTLITRDEIDRSGAGSIAQVLSMLPEVSVSNNGDTVIGNAPAAGNLSGQGHNQTNATTIQLRGLPYGSTLVLINGRRSGESSAFLRSGQFDLSTIPLSMVERIEVLPAGSSAIYGGDGLAGVVNIVLRQDASGLEMRVRRDAADGYGEGQTSLTWGRAWSRGSLTAFASWRENSALTSSERDLTADRNYTRYGGRDLRSAAFAEPAVVYSLEGCDLSFGFCALPLDQRGNLPGLDAPVAVVPAGQNGLGLTPADFAETAGQRGLESYEFPIITREKSKSIAVNGAFKISENLEFVGEFAYNQRRVPADLVKLIVNGGEYGLDIARVSADNPFNPFGVDVGIDYAFSGTHAYREFAQDYRRGLLGLRGTSGNGRWGWEVSAWRSEDKSSTGEIFAFGSSGLPGLLSSSDPDVAMNPFVGDESVPLSREGLNSLVSPMSDAYLNRVTGLHGFVRGKLMELPAGDVMAVAGLERQKTDFLSKADIFAEDVGGSDTSRALFTEFRVPIVSGEKRDGSEKLALTGAFRRESTKRFENNAATEVIGVEYRPTDSLLIRSSYSTAFKPLTIYSANNDVRVIDSRYNSPITDPQLGETYRVDTLGGGGVAPGLRPERSKSGTIGFVYVPAPGWRASLTGWNIDIYDRLSTANSQFFIDNEHHFPKRVSRNSDSRVIEMVDVRQFNIASTSTSGVDIALDAWLSTRYGEFIPSLAASYALKHKEKVSSTAPETSNLGIIRYTGWSPRWKVVPRIAWSVKDVHASLNGRYVSSYEDPKPLSNGEYQRLGSFWTFDANVEFGLGRWFGNSNMFAADTRLSVGATNLFDRLPDFCNFCLSGYDPSQYQIVGRKVYAELRFQF